MKQINKGALAFLLGVAVGLLPALAEAKPVAAVGTPESAHIILGDDVVPFCPEGSYLAIGKDVQGADYFGCWRFKPEDKEVVQIVWAQAPTELFELPKDVFEGVTEDMKV